MFPNVYHNVVTSHCVSQLVRANLISLTPLRRRATTTKRLKAASALDLWRDQDQIRTLIELEYNKALVNPNWTYKPSATSLDSDQSDEDDNEDGDENSSGDEVAADPSEKRRANGGLRNHVAKVIFKAEPLEVQEKYRQKAEDLRNGKSDYNEIRSCVCFPVPYVTCLIFIPYFRFADKYLAKAIDQQQRELLERYGVYSVTVTASITGGTPPKFEIGW